jgi:GNAT superfamily N-acetyltransferase
VRGRPQTRHWIRLHRVPNLPTLRPGRDSDASGFIALVDTCWAEYPGCVMDLDGEVPELRALATYYAQQNGALWAAEHEGRVVGMVATKPLAHGTWELCKMYAYADQRGTGLAQSLVTAVEAHARANGATEMRRWSDTRFDRAHRFYEKSSYLRAGPIRALNDLSNSMEFEYAKPLTGTHVQKLDAAAAVSALPRLSRLAAAPWKSIASQAATGAAILLAAWHEGTLIGTAVLKTPTTQPHRAALHILLVAPETQRQGIGRALLRATEAAAKSAGRELLTVTTGSNGGGARLLLAESWQQLGIIPDWSRNPDGTRQAATFFWKRIDA